MPYTAKVSSPGIAVDTNNDGAINGRVFKVVNTGNFNTFSVANGILTIQGPSSGSAIGGSDTHIQFNDGGAMAGHSGFLFDKTADSNTGLLTVANLTVTDTLTVTTAAFINANTVSTGDNIILLNSDATGSASASCGFEIERGDDANISLLWNESTDKWTFDGEDLSEVGQVFAAGSSVPVYTFTSDTNTGMEHMGGDQLGFMVGGTRRVAINANGLHVNGDGAAAGSGSNEALLVDSVIIDTATISTVATNTNLNLAPHGSGSVLFTSTTPALGVGATAHNVAGKALTLSAGTTTAGTTSDIAGGSLTISGGQGKGSGAGGDILFKTANAGSSGSSLNALATALTLSDDLSATFAGAVSVAGNFTVTGTTTTVSSTNTAVADAYIVLNDGESATDGSGVTGSVAGFLVDRGATGGGSPSDIATARFVWDDSVDAFRCQIASNAPTNSAFADTSLQVGNASAGAHAVNRTTGDGRYVSLGTPSLSGNLDTNGNNIIIDDNKGITDDSSNEQLWFQKITDATNYLEITNAATTTNPMLAVGGSDGNIGMTLKSKGTSGFTLQQDDNAGAALDVKIYKNSASPADTDVIGSLSFYGKDDGGNTTQYGYISTTIVDKSASSEDAYMSFYTITNATAATEALRLTSGKVTKFGTTSPSVAAGGSILRWDGTSWEPSEVSTTGLADLVAVTANTTVTAALSGKIYTFNKGSAGTFTLPSNPTTGTQYVLINLTANDVVITRAGSDTINGATSVNNTTQYAATTIVYAGSNKWYAFGGL
jgi:hypothetical protein